LHVPHEQRAPNLLGSLTAPGCRGWPFRRRQLQPLSGFRSWLQLRDARRLLDADVAIPPGQEFLVRQKSWGGAACAIVSTLAGQCSRRGLPRASCFSCRSCLHVCSTTRYYSLDNKTELSGGPPKANHPGSQSCAPCAVTTGAGAGNACALDVEPVPPPAPLVHFALSYLNSRAADWTFNVEAGLFEALLQSEHRTLDPEEAGGWRGGCVAIMQCHCHLRSSVLQLQVVTVHVRGTAMALSVTFNRSMAGGGGGGTPPPGPFF
jgi:hypothetical protein